MPSICTYMHLNLVYMRPKCGIYWHYMHICYIYAAYILSYMHIYDVYMQHISTDILHIGFIYAHVSSYRFFPCGYIVISAGSSGAVLSIFVFKLIICFQFLYLIQHYTCLTATLSVHADRPANVAVVSDIMSVHKA